MTTTINNEHKKLNVPNLRFPEFQGEWEKKSLGEIGDSFIGLTYKPTDVVSEGGLIVFRSSNIQNGCMDYKDIVRVNKNVKEKLITKKDDLLVCARNGSARLIGKNAILHEADANQTFGAFMMVFRSDKNHFVHQLLNTRRYTSQVSENLGARINQITSSDLSSFEFFFPTENSEMNKIAALLDLLDERIVTQSKIIEDLKKLKSAIIENHYNQTEKQTVSIADLGEPFSVGNLAKDDLTETGMPCVIYGELFTTYGETISQIESHTNKTTGMILSKKGDLLFPSSTTVDAMSLIAPSVINVDGVILGGDMFGIHINHNYNAQYLSYYFNHIAKRQLAKFAKGSTIIHLHYADLEKAKLLLPSLKEQNRMAKCLVALDKKVSVEQNLLSSLTCQKSYLLQQMFI
jgi:type I restriction enzyme S subunit